MILFVDVLIEKNTEHFQEEKQKEDGQKQSSRGVL